MAAAGYPDAWDEFFLVSIQPKGGSVVELAGITEDITAFEIGDKEVEFGVLSNGGRVVKKTPMGSGVLTLKVYDVSGKLTGTNAGVIQQFNPGTDDTEPISSSNVNDRNTYQVVILQCSSLPSTPTGASSATPTDASAERHTIKNAYMTAWKPSYDGKVRSAEVSFKWAPFTKSAVSNYTYESTDGSTVLPAVATFS